MVFLLTVFEGGGFKLSFSLTIFGHISSLSLLESTVSKGTEKGTFCLPKISGNGFGLGFLGVQSVKV